MLIVLDDVGDDDNGACVTDGSVATVALTNCGAVIEFLFSLATIFCTVLFGDEIFVDCILATAFESAVTIAEEDDGKMQIDELNELF